MSRAVNTLDASLISTWALPMITASKLAGYLAAHAIWCVSDGETLIPILGYTTEENEKMMERLVNDDLAAAVAHGKSKLDANMMDANDAVLLYDGRITVGDEKLDAIIMELRAFFSPDSAVVLAIPYTPKQTGKFLVHKPKLLAWDNCEDFEPNSALEAFFEGVAEHEQGAAIWNECLDESK